MATKKFIIEVEEGRTKCDNFCPLKANKHCLDVDGYIQDVVPFLRCIEYNLSTIKIKELEEPNEGKALLYAVEKTAKRTKKKLC